MKEQYVSYKEFDELFDRLVQVALDNQKYQIAERFTTVQIEMHCIFDDLDDEYIKVRWTNDVRVKAYIKLFNQLTEIAIKYEEYEIAIDMRKAQIALVHLSNIALEDLDDYLCLTKLSDVDGLKRSDRLDSY